VILYVWQDTCAGSHEITNCGNIRKYKLAFLSALVHIALIFLCKVKMPNFMKATPLQYSELLAWFRGGKLYHRERIWFSSTLSCIKEKEEITKTPRGLSPLPTKQATRAPLLLRGVRPFP
jgi:hypothetical protein